MPRLHSFPSFIFASLPNFLNHFNVSYQFILAVDYEVKNVSAIMCCVFHMLFKKLVHYRLGEPPPLRSRAFHLPFDIWKVQVSDDDRQRDRQTDR